MDLSSQRMRKAVYKFRNALKIHFMQDYGLLRIRSQ